MSIHRAIAIALLLAAGHAAAAITCTPTNNTIVFGNYDPLGGAVLDGTGSFQITCVDVGGPGGGTTLNWFAAASGATRQMAPPSGTDRLNYQLYTNSGRTTVWGDGTGGTARLTGTLFVGRNSSATTAPISYFGRITGSQDVSAASPGPASTTYSQSLTITVTCTRTNGTALAC